MAYTDREDYNYLGQLFLIGANKTPMLSMFGGLQGPRNIKVSTSFRFPLAQPWALSSASQNTQSEATAAAEGTPTTYTRGQDYNVCQIMKYDYEVTYAKQSTTGEFAGIQVIGDQPVKDELAFQRLGAMRQMAIDTEYSFIQGSFVDSTGTASTNQKTRGILEAISTNEVAASTADLTKAMIDEIMRTMWTNGAPLNNMFAFVGGFQMQNLSDIYGFAPPDRSTGGLAIKTIITDFGNLNVVLEPQIPADDIGIVDMSFVRPVFILRNGKVIEDTMKGPLAAKEGGFLYMTIGLDYGPEEYHGKITNLSTS